MRGTFSAGHGSLIFGLIFGSFSAHIRLIFLFQIYDMMVMFP